MHNFVCTTQFLGGALASSNVSTRYGRSPVFLICSFPFLLPPFLSFVCDVSPLIFKDFLHLFSSFFGSIGTCIYCLSCRVYYDGSIQPTSTGMMCFSKTRDKRNANKLPTAPPPQFIHHRGTIAKKRHSQFNKVSYLHLEIWRNIPKHTCFYLPTYHT